MKIDDIARRRCEGCKLERHGAPACRDHGAQLHAVLIEAGDKTAADKLRELLATRPTGASLDDLLRWWGSAPLVAEVLEELARWEALGERHDLKLRERGCKCHREEGDSPCSVHQESAQ